jgi:hypothetical protein
MARGRKTGGRLRGSVNRTTADIKAIAAPYGASAVAELAKLAGLTKAAGASNEATRVAALRELLDRGFGRPAQHIGGDDNSGPVHFSFEWAPALQPQPEAASHLAGAAATVTATADEDEDVDDDTPFVTWRSC